MRSLFTPLAFAASAIPVSLAALYSDASKLPKNEYDYIVIGGGTAGNVVANRLSENPAVKVLVLEAGISHEGVLPIQIPLYCSSLKHTSTDWNYTIVPQPGFNGRSIDYERGFVLGGSSSTNYLLYTRGSKDDFDAYAAIAKDSKWSWDAMMKYWSYKNEDFVAPNDNHNTTGQYIPSVHSTSGLVDVSLPGWAVPMDAPSLALTKELSSEFPFNMDQNKGNPLGLGWIQATVGDGQRSTSATAYLAPEFLARPNLDVLVHARVTKIVQNGTVGGKPRFDSVDFAVSRSTPSKRVRARKEIILSAGSFNSPQILQLSGIGDKKDLSKVGIQTIVDLPDVGKNGSDHVSVPYLFYVNSNDTYEQHFAPSVAQKEIDVWKKTHKGPLSYTVANQVAWLRLPENDTVIAKNGDPTPGKTSAHFELIFGNGVAGGASFPGGPTNVLVSALISPTSRGTVSINSTDPFSPPVIDPKYLSTETDIHILVESMKKAHQVVNSKSYKGYFKGYYGPPADVTTDEQYEQYARNNAGTVWHFVGTAGMTSRDAKYGVVDPDFRVKGTSGLRVVDASVLPFVPSAHTQAPIYLIAEMASDVIKGVVN